MFRYGRSCVRALRLAGLIFLGHKQRYGMSWLSMAVGSTVLLSLTLQLTHTFEPPLEANFAPWSYVPQPEDHHLRDVVLEVTYALVGALYLRTLAPANRWVWIARIGILGIAVALLCDLASRWIGFVPSPGGPGSLLWLASELGEGMKMFGLLALPVAVLQWPASPSRPRERPTS